jgi:hypothetical protein
MSNNESLNALVSQIGERSGLSLELDARGSCAIEYGLAFEIVLTSCDNGDSVLLHSPIQFLDQKNALDQLRRCLELSLYGAETGGGALGLDPESAAIVLWRRLHIADLDSHALEEAIIAFASASDLVRERLSAPDHGDGDESVEPSLSFAGDAALIRI